MLKNNNTIKLPFFEQTPNPAPKNLLSQQGLTNSLHQQPTADCFFSDRFIPTRRVPENQQQFHFKNDIWGQDGLRVNDWNSVIKHKNQQNMYKAAILGVSEPSGLTQNNFQVFKNRNILKFRFDQKQNKESTSLSSKNQIRQIKQIDLTPFRHNRKINKTAIKILDAPEIYDDFYMDLLDWSKSNQLSVALGNSVYLWNGNNSKVNKLFQMNLQDIVTCVSWGFESNILATSTNQGQIKIWDTVRSKKIMDLSRHIDRIGSISWRNNFILATGSKDSHIKIHDIRIHESQVITLKGHQEEICSLKWSENQQFLASGGNDNKVHIWKPSSTHSLMSSQRHCAAVRALAWSPHQHGLLISGGGTSDKTIRTWNTLDNTEISCIDTGSQICKLLYAKTVNEVVSTHGYSMNEINIWDGAKMEKIQSLTGHCSRVLFLAMSPDGSTIATAAGDETVRFWDIFPGEKKPISEQSKLQVDFLKLR